jgi:glyoxylase-like metal-dependent hydrolase (beta-lactamase superfamily II)
VILDGFTILIDVGSGLDVSNDQLEEGLARVESEFGEKCSWEDLTHVAISHGHIDHFGGLPFVRSRSKALVGVHELDRPVLTHYDDRLTIAGRRLAGFLRQSGLGEEKAHALMELYLIHKHLFHSVAVDFTFERASLQIGPLEVIHVPGHCPGQVIFRMDEVLFCADHVLEGISPHQAPERLMPYTGLGHYLESLERIQPWAGEVSLALGGHEGPIVKLPERIASIRRLHEERLAVTVDLLDEPRTLAQVAEMLFPGASGYHELLALEEAGAHLEYLEQRGFLSLANRSKLERGTEIAPSYQASLGPEEL